MWPFKKKIEPLTPVERAHRAVDELNAAIRELRIQPGYNNHKAYASPDGRSRSAFLGSSLRLSEGRSSQ